MSNRKTNIFFTSDTHFGHKNVLMFGTDTRQIILDSKLHNKLHQYWEAKKLDRSIEPEQEILEYWKLLVIEMNERIVANWNSQVTENDVVYILGDFSFMSDEQTYKLLQRLNGTKHLIIGNHDKFLRNVLCRKQFETISDYKEVYINDTLVCMFHYPIYEWKNMHRGSFHLYGHTHGSVDVEGKALDVGVDNRPNGDMMLWAWNEIKNYMGEQPIRSHH